ncbi:hypothetical protein PACTADRAFT_48877 [Pachysolen tannophilus NRRL Y-2460]|uniref:LicD/FKTN/FKRP nucleotidyltransferase domain-containing protein n=1 Tax=Pachysolen tannophilus NRRL Y-2460 TaxID=669874 RepID=A0A1E4TZE8_PACTA|nr:hypothetical protein PACTADRAFT_48877 [Pachysolen tannophilus NRRL Y-2460]
MPSLNNSFNYQMNKKPPFKFVKLAVAAVIIGCCIIVSIAMDIDAASFYDVISEKYEVKDRHSLFANLKVGFGDNGSGSSGSNSGSGSGTKTENKENEKNGKNQEKATSTKIVASVSSAITEEPKTEDSEQVIIEDEFEKYIGEHQSKNFFYDSPKYRRVRSFFSTDLYSSMEEEKYVKDSKNFKQFDKRLLPAFWLDLINNNLAIKDGTLDASKILPESFKLPFNWDLLLDVSTNIQKNKYFKNLISSSFNCDALKNLAPNEQPNDFDKYCEKAQKSEYGLPIGLIKKIDNYISDVQWRQLHAMIYALDRSPIPDNVMFLGAISNENESLNELSGSLVVPLQYVSNGKNDLTKLKKNPLKSYYSKLSSNYIKSKTKQDPEISKKDVLLNGISTYREILQLNKNLEKLEIKNIEKNFVPTYRIDKPLLIGNKIDTTVNTTPVYLDPKDFKWHLPLELAELDYEISSAGGNDNTTQLKHLKEYGEKILNPDFGEPRYYGIPSVKGENLDHYDWRFFNEYTFRDNKALHLATMHRLARVWFRLCKAFDVPTWLSHGPLIGWYWNGITLPYDYDLDLQLPIQSLHKLSKILNNTLIYDFTNEPNFEMENLSLDNKAELGLSSFLFDVNPTYFDRNSLKNIDNQIDARLIDTNTGIYIDITALSDVHTGSQYDVDIQRRILDDRNIYASFRMMIPTNIAKFINGKKDFKYDLSLSDRIRDSIKTAIDKFVESKKTKYSLHENSPTKKLFSNYVHCKNYHTYNLDELSPLIPTYFENSPTFVPSNWVTNLFIEYRSNSPLTAKYFNSAKFFENINMWIHYEQCPNLWDRKSGKILDQEMSDAELALECLERNKALKKEYERSKNYTSLITQARKVVQPKKLKPKQALNYDFNKDLKPILDKFDGHLLRPLPWAENYLFN